MTAAVIQFPAARVRRVVVPVYGAYMVTPMEMALIGAQLMASAMVIGLMAPMPIYWPHMMMRGPYG